MKKNILTKPEILAPAGNFEKLKTAFLFGADAAYIGNSVFGLRKYADNFSFRELEAAFFYAKQRKKRVYLVLNAFAQEEDLAAVKNFLQQLNALEKEKNLKPDAFIISDLGVMQLARQYSKVPIHVSTQASSCNAQTCRFYQDMGAKRIVLARECNLKDIQAIQENFSGEIEIFIHGAICASYSGRCVISNYTSGRDSNRGGCIQSCRHHYNVSSEKNQHKSYKAHIMNAKDLWSIRYLEDIMKLNIASLKIEGRMKSNFYLANSVATYRKALDEIEKTLQLQNPQEYEKQLAKVSNRDFSDSSFSQNLDNQSLHQDFNGYHKDHEFAGIIRAVNPQESIVIESKQNIFQDVTLYAHSQNKKDILIQGDLLLLNNEKVKKIAANRCFKMLWQASFQGLKELDILSFKPT